MRASVLVLLFVFPLLATSQPVQEKTDLQVMGTRFDVTAVAPSRELATLAIEAGIMEILRTDQLLSEHIPNSEVSEINRNAGVKPVKVSEELFEVLYRCNQLSALTGGAMDVTFVPDYSAWYPEGGLPEMPAARTVLHSVKHVGYHKIQLDSAAGTVFLPARMKLSFGAIGRGYAINRARAVMQLTGATGGAIAAAGNMSAWGLQANGEQWYAPITDPDGTGQVLSYLVATDNTVVTANCYQKPIQVKGRKYSNILDPRTGFPVSGLKSVTLICPDAGLAEALTAAVMVLGQHQGLHLINQLSGIACLLITDKNEVLTSANLELQFQPVPVPEPQLPLSGKADPLPEK